MMQWLSLRGRRVILRVLRVFPLERLWSGRLILAGWVGCLGLLSSAWAGGAEFKIEDSGCERLFVLSTNELFVKGSVTRLNDLLLGPSLRGRLDVERLADALTAQGEPAQLVLYEKGLPPLAENRRIATQKLLVELEANADPDRLAVQPGIKQWRRVEFAPGFFIFEVDGSMGALRAAERWRREPGVLRAEPLLGKRRVRKTLPNDPLFPSQWYLSDSGRFDLNLKPVWTRYRGRGITIGIVDDGLELDHPDLVAAVAAESHYDYRDNDVDPSPSGPEDYHGTAVAGILGARTDNRIGIAGVAHESVLIGVRLIGGDDQTDEQDSSALLHQNQVIQVSNNSWGAPDNGQTLDGPGVLTAAALRSGVEQGRGGKGTIFVWSAGNGGEAQDNANYDGYANSIYTIAVAGVTDQARQASFSEPGACLVISAPASVELGSRRQGITTTDLAGDGGINFSGLSGDLDDRDYTQLFGGTSAAAPMVSGVVALMLQANPNLGWRDVPEILIRTARKISSTDSDWQINQGGFHFNHKFGAGLIDAAGAVDLAEQWVNLPARKRLAFDQDNLALPIQDEPLEGVIRTFEVPPLRVEHVVVTVSIQHIRRGDLAIDLVSPYGTTSRLAERHLDTSADFRQWRFTSVFHWGENAAGVWQVRIADRRTGRVGTLDSLRLEIFGTPIPAELAVASISGNELRLSVTSRSAGRYELQSSFDLRNWSAFAQKEAALGERIEFTVITPRTAPAQFFRAVQLSSEQ